MTFGRRGACLAIVIVMNAAGIIFAHAAGKQILMTADQLRESGIALRLLDAQSETFNKNFEHFPNKCYYDTKFELSLSDDMLSHFKARGFSLVTLCLAIEGYSRFDVETGNPLPLAVPALVRDGKTVALWKNRGILLNVPDCYKAGVPILDCKRNFDFVFGMANEDSEEARKSIREYNEEEHAGMSAAARRDYSSQCTCEQIRVSKKDQYTQAGELSLPGKCRVDVLPRCVAVKVSAQDAAGALVLEDYMSFREAAKASGSQHGSYDVSTELPHGYGYMISGPEGDDPDAETVDLATARMQVGTAAPWMVRR